MLNTHEIFKNKAFDKEKSINFGFKRNKSEYIYTTQILNNDFRLEITVRENEHLPIIKVFDTETDDEYSIIHVPSAEGSFVGSVIEECENVLKEITQKCYYSSIFQTKQSKEIIDYVKNKYGDELEFLWEKFTDNAIIRRSDNKKWYLLLLTVSKNKIGLSGTDKIEIIDLRGTPETIENIIDNKNYFKGYHMNKKHWYTMCLDSGVTTKEILNRIDESYKLAKK